MTPLFDSDSLLRSREGLEEGAVLLRGFATSEAPALLEEVARIAQAAPFRHLVTPGGYTMSVAMTNCGRVGWVSDRAGYRYDPADPDSGAPWPAMPGAFLDLAVHAAAEAGFAHYDPDACLINRYLAGAKLGLHQDRDLARWRPAPMHWVRTLLKLNAGRALAISSTIAADLCVRVQREDLDEMLGNLLENACKWTNSRIALSAARADSMVVLTLDDDGPGLPHAMRTAVLERGVRIDEAAPGSGLGLAIVRDLAELYGGSICLDDSPLGGLQVRLCLHAS